MTGIHKKGSGWRLRFVIIPNTSERYYYYSKDINDVKKAADRKIKYCALQKYSQNFNRLFNITSSLKVSVHIIYNILLIREKMKISTVFILRNSIVDG